MERLAIVSRSHLAAKIHTSLDLLRFPGPNSHHLQKVEMTSRSLLRNSWKQAYRKSLELLSFLLSSTVQPSEFVGRRGGFAHGPRSELRCCSHPRSPRFRAGSPLLQGLSPPSASYRTAGCPLHCNRRRSSISVGPLHKPPSGSGERFSSGYLQK